MLNRYRAKILGGAGSGLGGGEDDAVKTRHGFVPSEPVPTTVTSHELQMYPI